MSEANGPGQSLGELLITRGWRQGSLFSAPSVRLGVNRLCASGPDPLTELVGSRKLRAKEKLVLVTQDCDIKADVDIEPYVEALFCKTEKGEAYLARIEANSARHFVVDRDHGLVAQAKYRVVVSKEVLRELSPDPWPADDKSRERFIRWLGRRYDRPAIPDAMVRSFQSPVESALRQLNEESPDVIYAFSRGIVEFRVSLPATEDPPFDIQVVLMAREPAISEEEHSAITAVMGQIRAVIDPSMVSLADEPMIVTSDEISLEAYRRTRALFLEYLTYEGNEIRGAEPYERI